MRVVAVAVVSSSLRLVASLDVEAMQKVTCPSGSTGPDPSGDCDCNRGLVCFNGDQFACPSQQSPNLEITYFDAGCKDCGCYTPVPTSYPPPPKYNNGERVCPDGTSANGLNEMFGDCSCDEGTVCFQDESYGCFTNINGQFARQTWGHKQDCDTCDCSYPGREGIDPPLEPTTAPPGTPSTPAPAPLTCGEGSNGPTSGGNCVCDSGLYCFAGDTFQCPRKGSARPSSLLYDATCSDCSCAKAGPARRTPQPVYDEDGERICPARTTPGGNDDCSCRNSRLVCFEDGEIGCRTNNAGPITREWYAHRLSCDTCNCDRVVKA